MILLTFNKKNFVYIYIILYILERLHGKFSSSTSMYYAHVSLQCILRYTLEWYSHFDPTSWALSIHQYAARQTSFARSATATVTRQEFYNQLLLFSSTNNLSRSLPFLLPDKQFPALVLRHLLVDDYKRYHYLIVIRHYGRINIINWRYWEKGVWKSEVENKNLPIIDWVL